MYQYRCQIIDIYDGDSLTLNVDLGFHIQHQIKIRLHQIDTPEIRGPERPQGLQAKQHVHDWIDRWNQQPTNPHKPHWPFIVHTHKTEKYGRWLANITPTNTTPAQQPTNNPLEIPDLTQSLKAAGHDTEHWKNW